MCCGSGRAAWRRASTPSPVPAAVARVSEQAANGGSAVGVEGQDSRSLQSPAPAPFHVFVIRYTGASAIRVRGPVTGLPYDFSGARPTQAVDVRDAAVLVRNGLFQRT